MKLCYENLDNIRLSKSKKLWIDKNTGAKLYYYEKCVNCGEPFLAQSNISGFCSRECSTSYYNKERTGKKNYFYGRKHSIETKDKISAKQKINYKNGIYDHIKIDRRSYKNPRWNGGKWCKKCKERIIRSSGGFYCKWCRDVIKNDLYIRKLLNGKNYSSSWNEKLRVYIKERDNYTCQNPKCNNENIRLDVHHIDYNKRNCNEYNLITLCAKCHSKSNYNRNYWEYFYKDIIKEKFLW